MKKFKVKAYSVGGINKVHRSGETVHEANFPPDHAEKLVKKGFLEPLKTGQTAAKKTPAKTGNGTKS